MENVMFAKIKEFFVARSFVARHGNRFLTVYHDGKWHNGQVAHVGLFSLTIRKAMPQTDRYVTVKHTSVLRVHRDHMKLRVREEQTAKAI
jgi:phage tail tube protein FII